MKESSYLLKLCSSPARKDKKHVIQKCSHLTNNGIASRQPHVVNGDRLNSVSARSKIHYPCCLSSTRGLTDTDLEWPGPARSWHSRLCPGETAHGRSPKRGGARVRSQPCGHSHRPGTGSVHSAGPQRWRNTWQTQFNVELYGCVRADMFKVWMLKRCSSYARRQLFCVTNWLRFVHSVCPGECIHESYRAFCVKAMGVGQYVHCQLIPASLFKLDVCLLAFVGLEVYARFQTIHFKCLMDTTFGIQIWKTRKNKAKTLQVAYSVIHW